MTLREELRQLKDSLKRSEHIQADLDKRVFHLRTLYDVSKDIFTTVEFDTILKNFLLMTMGNFGVAEGFILTMDMPSERITHLVSMGLDGDPASLGDGAKRLILNANIMGSPVIGADLAQLGPLPPAVTCALPFTVKPDLSGLVALGAKLVNEPYNKDDRELISTLVNNLTVALSNAKAIDDIKRLNLDLQEKNLQLSNALNDLQAALRKVEILESIKVNLRKFVPTTVSRLIEKSPTASIPQGKEQDVSVLFLDIQGYTLMTERLASTQLNELIERYFSVFMDAIYENNGDVNETAGDGLMVLFMSEDETRNSLDAVHAAIAIRQKATLINQEENGDSQPLVINMGISSGRALVGAVKYESYTGSRWTYTARGLVTNVASRIGALATEGAILISEWTADRVEAHVSLRPLGKTSLKNVSEEVGVFEVEH